MNQSDDIFTSPLVLDPQKLETYYSAADLPQASFALKRDFNWASKFLARKFFVGLSDLHGCDVKPVGLMDHEGTTIIVNFDAVNDCSEDFRKKVLVNPAYREFFYKFDVEKIEFHGSWPKGETSIPAVYLVNDVGAPRPL